MGLKKNKSNYRDLEFFWTDIQNTLANTKKEVMQAQVLLSTIDSSKFQQMLDEERLLKLEKIKEKLNRSLKDFESKVTNTKVHSDFDIFAFMQQQSTAFDKDIQNIYMTVGPFLAETYSSQILDRITLLEDEKKEKERTSITNITEQSVEEEKIPSAATSETNYTEARTHGTIFSNNRTGEVLSPPTTSSINSTPVFQRNSGSKPFKSHDTNEYELSDIGESTITNIQVPVVTPTEDPSVKDIDIAKYKIVTIFAALQEDFKNQTEKSQNHIDFLFKLRDRYPSVRVEIDKFIKRLNLKPSEKFEANRVIANTFEIEGLLHSYSIDK